MRRIVIVVTILVLSGAAPLTAAAQQASNPSGASRPATEQAWIIASVTAAIEGMSGKTSLPPASIADHIWSPATYRAMAEAAFDKQATADADMDVRAALVEPTSGTLAEQSERVSELLQVDMRRPAAHEAAALVVGVFALREASGWFDDVRPSLSRMAAHLAVARALRRPSPDETLDGTLARAVLAALAGRQRDAMTIVADVEARSQSAADRAWVRALKLRITGDWRSTPPADAALVVQLEHARAVRERLGLDAYLDYVDPLRTRNLVDWARIASREALTVEGGHIFTEEQIGQELVETAWVWSKVHGRVPEPQELLKDLDALPQSSPVERRDGSTRVQVLDWGTWAAHQQRHLAHAMVARLHHLGNLGNEDERADLGADLERLFGRLRLFPLVLRWMATTTEEYRRALAGARPLVDDTPELVPQRVWTLLLKKPDFVDRAAPFPLELSWFTPAVPAGTGFDLGARALRPGCPRPPTRQEAAAWAREMPYDHWSIWGDQWLGVDGKPSAASVRRAFGPLLEYDADALMKLLDYVEMPPAEKIETARSLCAMVPGQCYRVADMLLLSGRDDEAAAAYDRWNDASRDRVTVSNGVAWLFRYHLGHGHDARAEAIATSAGDTGSRRGVELLSEWHEREGRFAEAERLLHTIDDRYENTEPLGTFLLRRGLITSDPALQAKGAELLRDEYPEGPQRLVMHALPATPKDGVRFWMFGSRMAALGLEPTDIIVGVDGWRVHDTEQYHVASRLTFDERMTFTVFRHGRYQDVSVRVPERWLGTRFRDVAP